MRRQFQGRRQLPLEVNGQTDGDLIPRESGRAQDYEVTLHSTLTYMSLVGISSWFSPSVKSPRRVTLGLVMTDCPAPITSSSSPLWRMAQLLAGMFKLEDENEDRMDRDEEAHTKEPQRTPALPCC